MTKMNGKKMDEYYTETYYQASKDSDLRENKKFADIFKNDVPHDKIILDVGCGPGVALKFLAKYNKIFGIDLVDEYLEIAKKMDIIKRSNVA